MGTSHLYTTTTTVVIGAAGGCLVIDPAVTPDDIGVLAAELRERGLRVVAGFSTHPHWDHVLWSAELGTAPRYATTANVAAVRKHRADGIRIADDEAPGHDPDLFGRLTPLPDTATTLPWDGPAVRVLEHQAHAPGHAALHIPSEHVLLTADTCSDIEIPLLDPNASDAVADYRHALRLFAAVSDVRHVIPGHGSVGDGAELHRRIAADHEYLDHLAAGGGDTDPRLTEEWLVKSHQAHLEYLTSTAGGR